MKSLDSPVHLPRLRKSKEEEIKKEDVKKSESKIKLLELLAMTKRSEIGTGTTKPESISTKEVKQGLAILEQSQSPMMRHLNPKAWDNMLSNRFDKPNGVKLSSRTTLTHRRLRREHSNDEAWDTGLSTSLRRTNFPSTKRKKNMDYLNFYSYNNAYSEFRPNTDEREVDRAALEEESKKVFMIINSFGGSVGNGVTIHDALQFIKAGSLTLALGVAASAASVALGGGTIGERYITEGCHVMIHQPEGEIKGQASDVWIDTQEILKIRLEVAEIYSLATYRPKHKILHDLDRDFYLDALGTVRYGLADEIATNDVIHDIIQMTGRAWENSDKKQERLLAIRVENQMNNATQIQN